MTREEIKEQLQLEDVTIFLDPPEEYDPGIIGCTEDRCHLIYDFEKLVESLMVVIARQDPDEEDPELSAREWLEFNTIRAIPYMQESGRPIIQISLQEE